MASVQEIAVAIVDEMERRAEQRKAEASARRKRAFDWHSEVTRGDRQER
jgi:hypothetical protein